MSPEDVLVCITNHNRNRNALHLRSRFSRDFETIVIDSGSCPREPGVEVKLPNVHYPGLFNESVRQCRLRGRRYLFFVAADVRIRCFRRIRDIVSRLGDEIGIWAPSSGGQSLPHCRNTGSGGMRDVPFAEGFMFLVEVALCDVVYPVDRRSNRYGYGIDILLGYNCIKVSRKRCVIDDRVEVRHEEGSGYSQDKALATMYRWVSSGPFESGIKAYFALHRRVPEYWELLLRFLRE